LHSSEQEDDDWSLGVNKEEVDAFVQSVLEDMTKGMNDSKQIEYILSRRCAHQFMKQTSESGLIVLQVGVTRST
jgi:hypothetical protein